MNVADELAITRPAEPGDLEEVAELLHNVFGVRPSVEMLRWKFTGCAGRFIGSTVLAKSGSIVAFLGQIPVRVSVSGREVLAVQGADVAIRSEHRRLDVFLGMIGASVEEMRKARVAMSYGTPNAEATATMSALLGCQTVAPIPLLVRPLGASRHSRVVARAFDAGVQWTEGRHRALPPELRLARLDRFDDRFDAFWLRIKDDYPILLVRDAAALNWRYVAAPGIAYERICIERVASGEIEGYAVLGLGRRGTQVRGRIADLVAARNGDNRIAGALVRASVQWFREQGADVAEAWMFPQAHLRSILRGHAFMRRRASQGGFQANVISPEAWSTGEDPGRAANWFLSMGDSDTV